MAKRKRVTATVKMTYTDDIDLIAWWNSIPLGNRNAMMKEAMRAYIGREPVRQRPPNDPQIVDPTRFDQLCDDAAWMRDALNELPSYVERVIQHVVANAVLVHSESQSVSDRTDTMSDDAARRREERMKRKQW